MAAESKYDVVTSNCRYRLATRPGSSAVPRSGRRLRPVA